MITSSAWWKQPDGEKHLAVTTTVRQIRENQGYRKALDLMHASLYADRPITGFGICGTQRMTISGLRISLNVIRNMVGTVTSKIACKSRPKPMYLTEGGDYEKRNQAQNLEKFVGGVFYESKTYQECEDAFRECATYGTGAVKVYANHDTGRVVTERVYPWEIVVDDGEAHERKPRNLYQRKYVDRLLLAEQFPDHRDEIMTCEADAEDREFAYQTTADQVLVTEAWHLGESKKSPGRHCIVIANATLVDEVWKAPSFPFAFLRWSKDVSGFFGVGLAEELTGIQREINKLLQQIKKGHGLVAGHWMVQQGTTITQQINNDLAAIIKYAGLMPQYVAPAIIAPEVYSHLWQLYAKAFEIAGVSQMNATGQKPSGLDSAPAQRTYQDIQSERFLEVQRDYEEFVVDISKLAVRAAKEIGGGYQVASVSKNSIEFIKWSDVNLDEESYVVRVYPTALLPSTPAGKLAWAEDMIKAQVIPTEDVLDIVDFPDTEAYAKRANAARRIIERNIATMRDKGLPVSPEPFDPHPLALRLVNEAYHEARLDAVPDTHLELMRQYMATTQKFMQPPPPPPGTGALPTNVPPGAPPPMAGPPPGAPPLPMAA
ncbi:hypothetical protein AKJ09_03672 [Labilithrix luteola]|uniref:Portal protein n=1 Tax=Labilithrix luteola TaxID=1391654 RepID=A0A0K1PTZ0_9BACT|nr:portal protein [Labilithrix luteola]AKU97008.1 hypothetical protein AKJ09_03672 [Labilithrix luteola]